jgi:hypothetical protein
LIKPSLFGGFAFFEKQHHSFNACTSKILKAGGSAGIVIKNTFLSNTDSASSALRKALLTTNL